MIMKIQKIYNFLLLTGGLFAIALNNRAIRSGYDLNLSTLSRNRHLIMLCPPQCQIYLVHEFLAVLHHELDGGVLELLGVVEVSKHEALETRVHCQVVTQRLLQ